MQTVDQLLPLECTLIGHQTWPLQTGRQIVSLTCGNKQIVENWTTRQPVVLVECAIIFNPLAIHVNSSRANFSRRFCVLPTQPTILNFSDLAGASHPVSSAMDSGASGLGNHNNNSDSDNKSSAFMEMQQQMHHHQAAQAAYSASLRSSAYPSPHEAAAFAATAASAAQGRPLGGYPFAAMNNSPLHNSPYTHHSGHPYPLSSYPVTSCPPCPSSASPPIRDGMCNTNTNTQTQRDKLRAKISDIWQSHHLL